MQSKALILALLLLATLYCLPHNALADEQDTKPFILFNGEMIDQNAVSVSGVFPLQFKVYTDEKAKKPVHSEKKFVSVVDGQYKIALSPSTAAIKKATNVYVGVELDGKELVRMKVAPQEAPVALDDRIQETRIVGKSNATDNAFALHCPAGYIATGIKGTTSENGSIQTLQLVCTKTLK